VAPLSQHIRLRHAQLEHCADTLHPAGEVGRLLGAKWQEMNDAQKKVRGDGAACTRLLTLLRPQPYVDMAERDKLRAAKEKADYVRGLRD
jgi:hypothetical protein